jgi:hypothetical protein
MKQQIFMLLYENCFVFEITKYMVMSPDQYARRSHNIRIYNSSFERVEHLKYLEKNPNRSNSIQEETKSRLNSGNACYHSVKNILFSSLLSKIYKG